MSQQEKVHVFLGAPPASAPVQSRHQEGPRPSTGWISVNLQWSNGGLQPSTETDGVQATADAWNPELLPSGSVHEYLEHSFPNSPVSDLAQKPLLCQPLSVQTEHLSMWTLSQAMLLKAQHRDPLPHRETSASISSSSPELFSPEALAASSPPAPRLQEEGVVLEVTTDGLLCSQEVRLPAPSQGSPRSCPSPVERAGSSDSTCGPTTVLSLCQDQKVRYTILVAVVHPCHLKEVKAKSGASAGSLIPLASIVVTDQSDVEMKVVLWRRAAFWVLTVAPGDIVMISGLQVNKDRWRGEKILQSTFSSKLLNLGQVTHTSCPPAPQQLLSPALKALCGFLRQQRPLLLSLPQRHPPDLTRLPYASLCSLRVNTLVHARLRVTDSYTCAEWKPEAESRSRSGLQRLVVVMVEQHGGMGGNLLLWGGATSWLQRFDSNRDTIWDVRFLLVREGSTSERPELHTTPWSSARALHPSDAQQQNSRGHHCPPSLGASLEMDLATLLSQQFTGEVMLRVQVMWFQFQHSLQGSPQPVINSSTLLARIVAALRGDVTYTGCARCGSELDTDANGIYRACYPCLPFTSIRTFYRPAVMMMGGLEQPQVCVQVPPVALQKILVASPQMIHRTSGSEENIRMAAEKILKLMDLPKKTFVVTLKSVFLCDDNSVAISREFTLLHMQPLE